MSRLQEFFNAKDKNGKQECKSFASGVKAVVEKVKQAYPAIAKKAKKVAIEAVPYIAGAVAYGAMHLAGKAVGADPMTNHLGASAGALMSGLVANMLIDKKTSKR